MNTVVLAWCANRMRHAFPYICVPSLLSMWMNVCARVACLNYQAKFQSKGLSSNSHFPVHSCHEKASINKMATTEHGQQESEWVNVPAETTPLLPTSSTERYSVFSTTQKRLTILAAALASAFSPLSSNIYYPALNSIAKELHVSPSQINLTITTYMVCLCYQV